MNMSITTINYVIVRNMIKNFYIDKNIILKYCEEYLYLEYLYLASKRSDSENISQKLNYYICLKIEEITADMERVKKIISKK